MKIAFKREWLEYGMLLIVLGALLWLGPGRIWDHKIDHGYPYAFNAEDTFQHQARTEGILRIGHYKYEPIEHVAGIYPEFPGYYPPILSELGAVWASFQGLESFHTTPGLVFLSTLTSAAVMYFLIRRFNIIVAILSLPLYGYLFLSQIAFTYYTWGHWPAIFGQVFLILIAWAVSRMETGGWEIILALAFVGTFMSYTAWPIMGALFMLVFLSIYAVKNWPPSRLVLRLLLVGAGVFLLVSPFFVIFLNILGSITPYHFHVFTEWRGGGGVPQVGFPGIPSMLLVGMSILAIYVFIHSLKQKSKLISSVPLLFSITMFILGLSNYFGFGKRAFFIRLFWPFYLSLFLGLTIYYIGRIILQINKKRWSTFLAAVVTMVMLITIIITVEKPVAGRGFMEPQLWEAITWLRDDTPKHTTFAIMYGDVLGSDMLWNLHRHYFLIDKNGYIEAFQNLTVKRYYSSTIASEIIPFWVIPADHHKKNPIFWGWEWNMSYDYLLRRDRDICAYDYILFTKQSREPVLAQYGLYIANLLLEKPWMTVAFENDYTLILHNAKLGDACIEDQKIQQAEE